jgi:hypothetical protein
LARGARKPQILALLDRLDEVNADEVAECEGP